MIITDEILNKIIDNELDQETRIEAMDIINNSEELTKRLSALKLADKHLKDIPELNVSYNFNNIIFDKINKAAQYAKTQKRFFIAVFSIIVLLLLGVFVFFIISTSSMPVKPSFKIDINTRIIDIMVKKLEEVFSGKVLTIFSSIISLIIISVIYFLEESKKIKKLKNG
ncbi:MAG: hypothetical protein Q8903_02965 [Bacteroidota bacterium]|nr:hypothetical protein [Bacteroidota bacterium]